MSTGATDGFIIRRSEIWHRSLYMLALWYNELKSLVDPKAGVSHYDVPAHMVHALLLDRTIKSTLDGYFPCNDYSLVHTAFHNNPSGASPLDWHSDDCKPWFNGHPENAPKAVRIWFFPQDVWTSRGPLQLIPSNSDPDSGDAITVTCDAGSFIAVYDMALIHRQLPNTSGLDRFMVRLEFAESSSLERRR